MKRLFGKTQGRPVLGETLETYIMANQELKWESNVNLTQPEGPPDEEEAPPGPARGAAPGAPPPPPLAPAPAPPANPAIQEVFTDDQSQEVEAFAARMNAEAE